MSERYEPGTELYAARDCQGWSLSYTPGEPMRRPFATRGEYLGALVRYSNHGRSIIAQRGVDRLEWQAVDVTAGAVQQELGL